MSHIKEFEIDKQICMQFEEDRERFSGADVPPTFQNTLFTYPTLDELSEAVRSEKQHYLYGRGTNPTIEIVEKN